MLKSYVVSTRDQELLPGPWKSISVEEQVRLEGVSLLDS